MKYVLPKHLISAGISALGLTFAIQAPAALVGVDNVHGATANSILASGSQFDSFRATLIAAGHTIVPLNSFSAASLSGLDTVILATGYTGNIYSASDRAAIQSFTQGAVFTSDKSMFSDNGEGADTPITFGGNQQLLRNIVDYLDAGHGTLFIGEDGGLFDIGNFNSLVSPYGVQYAASPTDGDGRTVTGFVGHPITAGIATLGVDFQMPMTVNSPSLDLTTGGGQDNILAVFPFVAIPEPATMLFGWAMLGVVALRRNSRG